MPRHKAETILDDPAARAVLIEVQEGIALREENTRLRDLIKWIAPRIQRVNGSGMGLSDKWCILCVLGRPEFKRQPCRHQDIWQEAAK